MKRIKWLALGVVVLALAACNFSGKKSEPMKATQPTATVTADPTETPEHLTEQERLARVIVFNAPTRAACAHIKRAVDAQARHDWRANVIALEKAYAAGQQSPGHNLGEMLQNAGLDDTSEASRQELIDDGQTLNEMDDRLAIACHIPLVGLDDAEGGLHPCGDIPYGMSSLHSYTLTNCWRVALASSDVTRWVIAGSDPSGIGILGVVSTDAPFALIRVPGGHGSTRIYAAHSTTVCYQNHDDTYGGFDVAHRRFVRC